MRVKKGLDQLLGESRSYHLATQAEQVHIVVFHRLTGGVGVVCDRAPYAFDLVGDDRSACPASANHDSPVRPSLRDRVSDRQRVVGVIDTVVAMGAQIEHGVTLLGKKPG